MTALGHCLMPASPPGPVAHLVRRRWLAPYQRPDQPPPLRHGQRHEGFGLRQAEGGVFFSRVAN